MPTTDATLIEAVVRAVDAACPQWAVLHREAELGTGSVTSDVDLIVDRDPGAVIRTIAPTLAARGVLMVQTWEYDRAERSTIFVHAERETGVQLDLVRDNRGSGVCGFRSTVLLAGVRRGVRWPTLNAMDSHLYLTRKRQVKSNLPVLLELRAQRSEFSVDSLVRRAREIFEPKAADHLIQLITLGDGVSPLGWGKGPSYTLGTWTRRLKRLKEPPGVILLVAGDRRALDLLAAQLNRLVVEVQVLDAHRLGDALTSWRQSRRPVLTLVEDTSSSRRWTTGLPRVEVSPNFGDVIVALHERVISRL